LCRTVLEENKDKVVESYQKEKVGIIFLVLSRMEKNNPELSQKCILLGKKPLFIKLLFISKLHFHDVEEPEKYDHFIRLVQFFIHISY